MANLPDLQVMSPTGTVGIAGSDPLQQTGTVANPLPPHGHAPLPEPSMMEITPLRNARGDPVQTSPTKHDVKIENDRLRQELFNQNQQFHTTTQSLETQAAQEKQGFWRAAHEYQIHARDTTQTEVAQAEVRADMRVRDTLSLAERKLTQEKQAFNNEQQAFRAIRTEAQQALHDQKQEVINHAESVLHQRTDAVATEANQALQAKHDQLVSIENQAYQHIQHVEQEAEGQILQRDMDLQTKTQTIMSQNSRMIQVEEEMRHSTQS